LKDKNRTKNINNNNKNEGIYSRTICFGLLLKIIQKKTKTITNSEYFLAGLTLFPPLYEKKVLRFWPSHETMVYETNRDNHCYLTSLASIIFPNPEQQINRRL